MEERWKIKPFGDLTVMELHGITRAREEVFYLEQRVTCPDADAVDSESTFLWVEQEGAVVGFLRIIPPGVVYPEISIGRVLVRREVRRNGLCRRMMLRAIRYVEDAWTPGSIRISAQVYLIDFYRELGFKVVSGEYEEAGIPHVKMLRK